MTPAEIAACILIAYLVGLICGCVGLALAMAAKDQGRPLSDIEIQRLRKDGHVIPFRGRAS